MSDLTHPDAIMPLQCAPCLAFGRPPNQEHPGDVQVAMTIKDGTALCYRHFEYGLSIESIRRWDHREQP